MLKKLLLTINNKRTIYPAGIIGIAFGIVILMNLIFPRGFAFMNAKLNDGFFRLRRRLPLTQKIDPAIVHVDLTDEDIRHLALSQCDRSVYHEVLDVIYEAHAAMIGFDVLFDERLHAKQDEQLINAAAKNDNVYYPIVLAQEETIADTYPGLYKRLLLNPTSVTTGKISPGTVLYAPFNELIDTARGLGHINCTPDRDGINRKIPLIFQYNLEAGTFIPALALRMICDYLSVADDDIRIKAGKHIILGDALKPDGSRADITIPIDKRGRMIINWAGPWRESFPHYSIKKLLLTGIEPVFKDYFKKAFENKIVIISDRSLKSKDQGLGVYTDYFPLSTIHSNIMNNILTGNFMKPVTPGFSLFLTAGLIFLLLMAARYFRPSGFIIAATVIFIGYMGLNFVLFVFLRRLGYLFAPGLGMIIACAALSGYYLYLAVRDKIISDERNKLNTNFFINIAHETKTPLTLMINYLEKYIKKKGLDEDLAVIKYNMSKLKDDMTNFMDAQALELGRTVYNHDSLLNITTFIEHKAHIFTELYRRKNMTVSTSLPDTPFYVMLHPAALDRIMNNLLENAFKYGTEGGQTTITLTGANNKLIISVSDTGIGIKPDELEHIFKPYYQVSRDKRPDRGMGMGLYIIKKLIDETGGSLTVTSTPGKGSTFTVKLPVVDPGDEPVVTTKTTAYEQAPIILKEPVLEEIPFDPDKNTVLIVDDNREMLGALHAELTEQYNVIFAENGVQALSKLKTAPIPDIIVSDIIMDEMDGYTFFKKLHKDSRYHSVPFIFITAKDGRADKLKALDMGAVVYLSKPFLMDELKAEIAALIDLQKSKALDAMEQLAQDNKSRMIDIFEQCKITKTERKVITHVIDGLQNKEIAGLLKVKEATIKFHLTNIFKKCQVQTRVELVNKFKFYLN